MLVFSLFNFSLFSFMDSETDFRQREIATSVTATESAVK